MRLSSRDVFGIYVCSVFVRPASKQLITQTFYDADLGMELNRKISHGCYGRKGLPTRHHLVFPESRRLKGVEKLAFQTKARKPSRRQQKSLMLKSV